MRISIRSRLKSKYLVGKMSEKSCEGCEETKPMSEFRQKKRSKLCRECELNPEYSKVCSRCGDKYLSSEMETGICCIYCKKGNWRVCTVCGENKTTKQYRRGQPICLTCEEQGEAYDKVCKDCGETKPSSEFRRNRGECLDCERSFGKGYRRTTTKAKEWAQNNKARMTELQKNWYEENKKEIRQKEIERKAADPVFKLIKDYRSGLSHLFNGDLKQQKQLQISFEGFRLWLSYSFYEESMKHTNYGKVWNVDHVLPLDLLYKKPENEWCWSLIAEDDLEEILFSWYNTQPLTKEDNREKGGSITLYYLKYHYINLKDYMKDCKIKKEPLYFKYMKILTCVIDAFYE